MQNKEIARAFKLTGQLMELHGENKFKIRTYSNAAFRIDRLGQPLEQVAYDDLESLDGIGKSVAAKIVELLETGEMAYLQELLERTPEGIRDMLTIKGIGAKKIGVIWKELGVESLGELLYACNENRLVDLKGFGDKTQEQIKKAIEYKLSNSGKYHYAAVESLALDLVEQMRKALDPVRVELTGQMRRKCQVVDKVEILVGAEEFEQPTIDPETAPIAFEFIGCKAEEFESRWLTTTGTEEHLAALAVEAAATATEQEIYAQADKPYVAPEMREGRGEFAWSENHTPADLVELDDLKGILHNHSTWSDGRHSLEEMATYCRDLGYEYLGISDHSKSAFYANGLTAERIAEQHAEIEALNEKLGPFKIFKGIESDILNDGSLDYDEEVLASFDFIVASVHSNLKMDEEKATQRLITAVENPYTTILGHPTGRLLLARPGYPIDHKKVIDACAANGVVMELNSNPHRLDIDWRWIDYCLEKGVMVSLNPDAHRMEGYHDMHFGVCAARKGGLLKDRCFNALSRDAVAAHFVGRKA